MCRIPEINFNLRTDEEMELERSKNAYNICLRAGCEKERLAKWIFCEEHVRPFLQIIADDLRYEDRKTLRLAGVTQV